MIEARALHDAPPAQIADRANPKLAARIRVKYKTKNTTGYSLNALLDFDGPVDIFTTCSSVRKERSPFIAEAVLNTVQDYPLKSTALLLYSDLYAACFLDRRAHPGGAAALELMDRLTALS